MKYKFYQLSFDLAFAKLGNMIQTVVY